MVSLRVVRHDILDFPCDLLVLKHADGFHGVDRLVCDRIGFRDPIKIGEHAVFSGTNIKAQQVLILGVGPFTKFRYAQIRDFGRRALKIAMALPNPPRRICSPVHGPGYGLDERESFLSLVGGFSDAIANDQVGASKIKEIFIVERQPTLAEHFGKLLAQLEDSTTTQSNDRAKERDDQQELSLSGIGHSAKTLSEYGERSESKTRLFVAMPFSEELSDVYEIAIVDAASKTGVLCERIDRQAFTGDVLAEIMDRISRFDGVIALLNEANPNVFLEIGFAWGKGKPTILVAKQDQHLPFDVRGQKRITYKNIKDLKDKLTEELAKLKSDGVLKAKN